MLQTTRKVAIAVSILSFSFSTLFGQVVTPWLTTGTKSSLLQQGNPISFGSNTISGNVVIAVDSTTTYQTMDGFGFCLTEGSAEVISSLASTQQDLLLNELFSKTSGLGISVLRISIGASDLSSADYSYNETSGDVNMVNFSLAGLDLIYLVPILKKALAINPDIKILATPWSPPKWMKTNGLWVGGNLKTDCYAAYANYFVKYIAAMKTEGISIWGITPQNEPENPNNDPSLSMTATEQKNFINNNLGPAMSSVGYSNVKIIAFDHNCDNTAYPIDVCNNSSYVDGAAFHLYAGNISALTTVKNATNKNIYFTEQYTGSGGSFSGDFGWHLQNVITGAANNWAKTIIEWNLATNTSFGPHTPGGCSTCLGAITVSNSTTYSRNVSYYIVGQISKFVHTGAVRIASTSTNSGVSVSAFRNTDGSTVVLAYNGNSSSQILKITNGLSAFNYTIPASSAVTFVWNNALSYIQNIYQDRFSVSPNPVSSVLNIKGANNCNELVVFSLTGEIIIHRYLVNQNDDTKVNVSELKKGVYLLNVRGEGVSRFVRFVKI